MAKKKARKATGSSKRKKLKSTLPKRRPLPFQTRNVERDRRQSFRRLVRLRTRLFRLEERIQQKTSPSPKWEKEAVQLRQEIQKLERRFPEATAQGWVAQPPFEFPSGYGDHKIVLLVRDPWWLYAYWEVRREEEENAIRAIRAKGLTPLKSILRVYDVTGLVFDGTNAHASFDIDLHSNANNWYIDVGQPNRSFVVEIGIVASDGSFHPLCRSNQVTTPRYGMSEVLDEEWMTSEEEYWRMFGLSGGYGIGKSSLELKEIVKKRLVGQVSSGALFSPAFLQKPRHP